VISSDPEKAAEDLEKWATGLEQRAARYTELQHRMDATSATESSSDGAVRVTVDANGVPTDLVLTERARGVEPTQLSAQILATMRRAQSRLRQQVLDLVRSTVPADDEPARNLVAQYEQRFPEVLDDNGPARHEVTREHDFRPDDDEQQGYLR
jgi:hypothetical protein